MTVLNYTILIKGKVQGVWFRKYTKEKADELGIKGYVENTIDNSVFISAEATKEVLDKFIDCLHKGSPLSSVDEVLFDFKGIDLQGYREFEIRKTTI